MYFTMQVRDELSRTQSNSTELKSKQQNNTTTKKVVSTHVLYLINDFWPNNYSLKMIITRSLVDPAALSSLKCP